MTDYTTKPVITLKYIKEGNFNSSLFKVYLFDKDNKILMNTMKTWDNSHFIYLKNKLLPKDLHKNTCYRFKLYYTTFETDDNKTINYIKKIKGKISDFKPPQEKPNMMVEESSDDSDF